MEPLTYIRQASLEERINLIMHSPELELDGNAYIGKYELNDRKSIITFMASKLRLNDVGKNIAYTNFSTGEKITLSGKSINKLTHNFDFSNETYQKTLAHIPQIIEKMQFLEEMPLAPDKKPKFNRYSYYIMQAKIDGESYIILSTVGHMGEKIYYDQNLFKGTAQEVFAKAKNKTNNPKYSRLNEIVQNI